LTQETITIKFKASGDKPLIAALNNLAKAQRRVTNAGVPLVESTSNTNKALKKFSGAGARASRNANNFANKNKLLGGTLSVVRSKLLIYTFAFTAFNKVVFDSIKALGEQEKAEAKIERVLKTTGHAAKLTSTELKSYARHIAETTEFADELVLSAEAMLLTFTKINGEVFKDALAISADMSVAFGQDLKSSVIQVGKALNDPAKGFTALRRIGVSFSKEQEKLIKGFMSVNDLASAQKVILDELQTEFGGVASNVGNSAMTVAQLGNAWGDFMEVFGETVAPVVTPALKSLTEFFQWFQSDLVKTESTLRSWGATEADIKKHNALFLQTEIAMSEARNKVNLDNISHQTQAIAVVHNMADALANQVKESDGLRKSMLDANDTLTKFGFGTDETRNQLLAFFSTVDKDFDIGFLEDAKLQLQSFWENGFETPAQDAYTSLSEVNKKAIKDALLLIVTNEEKLAQAEKDINVQKEYNQQVTELLRLFGFIPEITAETSTTLSQFWEDYGKGLKSAVSAYDSLLGAIEANANAHSDAQKRKELATANEIRSEKRRTREIERINKKYDAENEARAKRMRGWKIASAISNTALSFTQTIADETIKPAWLKPIIGAMILAQGYAQVKTIQGQKFADGGVIGGRLHSQGGTMIEAERGEFIMSRSAVESVGLETMNQINQGGGTGNVVVNFSGNVMSNDFIENEAIPQIKEAVRRGADIGIS
jgi:hypothetical protein